MSEEDIDVQKANKQIRERGYVLEQHLGSGAYGSVWKATFKRPSDSRKQELACKVIDTSDLPEHVVKNLLPRELEIVRWIDHPNVVRCHSMLKMGPTIYIFMEFVTNGTLLKFLRENANLSEANVQVWFGQICSGLLYLHMKKFCHRDIKADNILITRRYNMKIADFGFSRNILNPTTGQEELSKTYCGTPAYCAPEVLKGQPYRPIVADAWSTGVLLYAMMNRVMPFNFFNVQKAIQKQENKEWEFTDYVKKNFSKESKEVVTSLLEPDPKKRATIAKIVLHRWFSAGMTHKLMMDAAAQAKE